MVGVDSVRFDYLPRIHEGFSDPSVANAVVEAYEDAARRLIAQGADTIFGTGVHTTMAASAGLRAVDGVVIQDTYALLARFAETAAAIHRYTGHWTSRGPLYAKPSAEILERAAQMYGIQNLPSDQQLRPESS